MTNSSLAEIATVLNGAKKVAVACHVRPDGDALGSALALTLALKNAGKTVYPLCEDEPPERLCIFPAMALCLQKLPVRISDLDLLIYVDCAEANRVGVFTQQFAAFKGKTLNIDHHISNPRYAKYNYVLPESTATCEILPEILRAAKLGITKDMADLLALGLLTDSGDFAHSDVSAKTFTVAAELRACGADINRIIYEMFTRQTKNRAILYGRVISRIRFELDDKLAIITVWQKDFEDTATDKSQTEGFVDFPLSIDGVEVSASLMEVKKNQFKVSFRSKRVNVNAVAGVFGGGGHVLASGCMINGEYEEVVDRLRHAVYQQL